MNRYEKYLQLAEEVLKQFHCRQPLAVFLKEWFSLRPQLGSRDRKYIARLCYQYFRLGKRASANGIRQKLIMAALLDEQENEGLLQSIPSEVGLAREVFNQWMADGPSVHYSLPPNCRLSDEMDEKDYASSLLVQPDLFLRMRPGHESRVKNSLHAAGISFTDEGNSALRLPNATRLPENIRPNTHYVVQDWHSQRVLQRLAESLPLDDKPFTAWDCCAGSGGKGLMLHDLYSGVKLLATDIRNSILQNLKKRFHEAGISGYRCIQMDIAEGIPGYFKEEFDLVLADVPCTGSGTWARTPEQLACIQSTHSLATFARRQLGIAKAAAVHVKPGGWLVYITCSVFRNENEEIIQQLASKELRLLHVELLDGTRKKCDSMFLAIFQQQRSSSG
jgi:16S rRNA (cytosine967-C5)-methyltransferase